jgi:S1-C subfamily serine protease
MKAADGLSVAWVGLPAVSGAAPLRELFRKVDASVVDAILLTDELARLFNLPQPAGLLIQRIAEGSPAVDWGMRAGTLRMAIGGQELLAGGDIILELGALPFQRRAHRSTACTDT